jgi:hypothetical protein
MTIEKTFIGEKAKQAVLDDEFNTCMNNPDYLVNLIAYVNEPYELDWFVQEAKDRGLDIGDEDGD